MAIEMTAHAEIVVINVKNKSSATQSRLISAPKNLLLNRWKAGNFIAARPAVAVACVSEVGRNW
jgi:hypothetical protein